MSDRFYYIYFGHRFALISKTPPDQKLKAGWTAFAEKC